MLYHDQTLFEVWKLTIKQSLNAIDLYPDISWIQLFVDIYPELSTPTVTTNYTKIMDDDDDDEPKHKPDLNFGVPKNIKKKPILIPAKGEYKFKGSANNKVKNAQGVTVVKETFLTDVDDQEAWEKLMDMRVKL